METLEAAKQILLNDNVSISKRMRALFFLKNIKTPESAQIISLALKDKSILLKHEVCYVLGQMLLKESIGILKSTLSNQTENEIVRHEAGEALGNYVTENQFLQQFLNDGNVNVRETCYLAFKKHEEHMKTINNKQTKNKDHLKLSPFDSYDPAFCCDGLNLDQLKEKYLFDTCMYEQYKAMFALRDLRTDEAVDVIGQGFNHASALFKHEVAFVFGQMRMESSVKYLKMMLEKEDEHEMVRHECAEALGAIGSDEALDILKRYISDKSDVVRESVEVALDIHEYERGAEAEYAQI